MHGNSADDDRLRGKFGFLESINNKLITKARLRLYVGVGSLGHEIANHEQLLRHITCRKQKRIVPLRLLFPYEGIEQLICP